MYKSKTEKLTYEKVNIRKYIGMIALSLIIVFLLSSFIWKEVIIIRAEKEVVFKKRNDSFSKERFFAEIDKYSFKYPDIIKAQAIVESGHFKSPVFLQNNNMFGMRQAVVRITLAKKTNLNHAYYNHWKECVIDRALYEARYLSKLSREEYFSYLDQVYAEGDGYSKLLKEVIQKNRL